MSTDLNELREKIVKHAGLTFNEPLYPNGVSYILYQFGLGNPLDSVAVQTSFDDLCGCICDLNSIYNWTGVGPNPKAEIDRHVAYAINLIVLEGWEAYLPRQQQEYAPVIRAGLERTMIAWDAILCGDIEDINEHVMLEFAALQLRH